MNESESYREFEVALDRARDYRYRLRNDIEVALRIYGVNPDEHVGVVDELVDTAMHPVERLLVELIEAQS